MSHLNAIRPIGLANGPSPLEEIDRAYSDLEVVVARPERALWCYLKPQARPSFTEALLRDLHRVRGLISQAFENSPAGAEAPLRYFILASRTPGVFNLGGDLALFSAKIQAGDREALRRYAYSCVDACYANSVGFGNGIITIGLAQGDALGGGWESLMSCDRLVAERQARFALPEVLFNLFPGMGAHAYLSRRVGMARAEEIIMSGKVYTAEEMHAWGIVDVLAEDGDGVAAVRRHILDTEKRSNSRRALRAVRNQVHPVTHEELIKVTEIWVDTALGLSEDDLRHMQLLVRAQARRAPKAAQAVPQVAAK